MTAIIILMVLWVILGVVGGVLSQRWFKRPAPFGVTADYIISVATAVGVGLLDWLWALPTFGFTGPLAFAGALAEPFLSVFIVLWILRQVKPATAT